MGLLKNKTQQIDISNVISIQYDLIYDSIILYNGTNRI